MTARSGTETAAPSDPLEETLTLAGRIVACAKKIETSPKTAAGRLLILDAVLAAVAALGELHPALERHRADTERAATEDFEQLQESLRAACGERQWHFDGHWPTFHVERAIPVLIEESRRSAKVGASTVRIASLEAILDALTPQVASLIGAKFSPEAFLEELAEAYRAHGAAGPAPLFEIYRTLVVRAQRGRFWRDVQAKDFIGISADQFRARLSKILERGTTRTRDGRQLRLSPPLDAEDGLFAYLPDERRFAWVGFIEFVGGGR